MQIDANVILNFIHKQRLNWPMALGYDRREADLLERLERLVKKEMMTFEAYNDQHEESV